MTRLRPWTARQVAHYPATPVVYRRRFLHAFFALVYAGFAILDVWLLATPAAPGDDASTRGFAWLILALLVGLGGAYLIYSPPMVIDATHVHINNPFRSVAIPLGHVTQVLPGSTFSVETAYGRFYAWGIEAANFQLVSGGLGTQDDVAELITRASHSASNADDPPARYTFKSPSLFFWAVAATYLGCALYAVFTLP